MQNYVSCLRVKWATRAGEMVRHLGFYCGVIIQVQVQVQVQNGLFSQKSSLGVQTTNQQEKNNLKNISISLDNS